MMATIEETWSLPAAGTYLDVSQHPYSQQWPACPMMVGRDPRFPGAWRKLPGFRAISRSLANSRIRKVSDLGVAGSDNDDVRVDYFRPLVVKYGSDPHERRGFVISAENRLIFKYYDTKDSTWKVRTLCTDLDARFGTRSGFEVVSEGRNLYVSRPCQTITGAPTTVSVPQVFSWDADEWVELGGGIQDGVVYDMCCYAGVLYLVGTFRTVGGSKGTEWSAGGFHGVVALDGTRCTPIGYANNGECLCCCIRPKNGYADAALIVGGSFTAGYRNTADPAVTIAKSGCLVEITLSTLAMSSLGNGFPSGKVSSVNCLKYTGSDNIYVGGSFTQVNFDSPTNANSIALLKDGVWQALGAGSEPGPGVLAIEWDSFDKNLIVGGSFADKIKMYSSGVWVDVDTTGGDKPNDTVYALKIVGDTLYVGGAFTAIGSMVYKALACISGWGGLSGWAQVATGVQAGTVVYSLIYDLAHSSLYIGGKLTESFCGINASDLDGVASDADLGVIRYDMSYPSAFYPVAGGLQAGDVVVRKLLSISNDLASYLSTKRGLSHDIIACGDFTSSGSSSVSRVAGLRIASSAPSVGSVETTAMAGNKPWATIGFDCSTERLLGSRGSGFVADHWYNVRIRFTNPARGWMSPLSDPVAISTDSDADQPFREIVLDSVPSWVNEAYRPTRIQIWRTIGAAETDVKAPNDGPYFLESEVPYDPFGNGPNRVIVGWLTDTALENKVPFDAEYDIAGSHGAGPVIGISGGVMFSLAGASAEATSSYWDIRWSPPWVAQVPPSSRIETTVYSGYHRTRVSEGELPRFIEVGDYMLFCTRSQITRLHKSGEYLSVQDGPTGVGVLNREAMAAIGGELWFITNTGELARLAAATGSFEIMHAFTRWLQTRWKKAIRARRMSVTLDPQSGFLVICPLLDASDTIAPQEALCVYMPTMSLTVVPDLYPAMLVGGENGIDPETGRPAAFMVTPSGMILCPDWADHGVWDGHVTLSEPFFNQAGLSKAAFDVTDISASGGGEYVVTVDTADGSLDVSGSFGIAHPATAYLLRSDSLEAPDTAKRMRIVAVGTISAHSASQVTVQFSGGHNGNRVLYGDDLTDFGDWSDATLLVSPTVLQVWNAPVVFSLDNRLIFADMGVQFGEHSDFTGDQVARDAFVIPDAIVFEEGDGWRFDRDSVSAPGIALGMSDAASPAALGIPANRNIDHCWLPVPRAGHVVIPCITHVGAQHGKRFELLAVGVKGRIEESSASVASA